MSIWGLSWPWRTKKGRTIESLDKRGRLRVKCVGGGSPVTWSIENHRTPQSGDGSYDWPLTGGKESRRTRCPECGRDVGVTGPTHRPRMFVHNGDYVL